MRRIVSHITSFVFNRYAKHPYMSLRVTPGWGALPTRKKLSSYLSL